ncbi:FAD-dependent oxidoreductase [Acidiphilium sp. AL]|uniref:FAD-dependent oxidoreductase n=1 Tax=Acidiphilium sp. AL TaxID=2871704 RepID=UPI0021CB13E5|nr:FAD-dependent oxidoreductase [Acidiphilium sp. AL]
MARFAYAPFPYRTPPELSGGRTGPAPVAIVGAGPVGLAAAIDLALHGVKVVILDDNDTVSTGSRAICWSKRSLEIFDRLGIGERMVAKGVTWQVGRLFHRDREIYAFDLLPEQGHKMPAFINLQQYYVEHYLVERCADFPDLIDLRWKNKLIGVARRKDGVVASVETPDGTYDLAADWLIACDGARSRTRELLGLDFAGQVFEDRFLIADVEMTAEFPSERWFWFDPPFHQGQSALLHKQPDHIYRIDLQLGRDADPEEEKKPELVIPRIQAIVGDREFSLDWVSVYTFQCRRLDRFVHDRVIFAGDAAHVVSPFGARGGNGGIQDVDNLAWKLAMVIHGNADAALLASYDEERIRAADENIRHSARATNFMTPKSDMERIFRNAAIELAADHGFARRMVNSGRLSLPCSLAGLSLQTDGPDCAGAAPGLVCPDAPVTGADGRNSYLLDHLGGSFTLLAIGDIEAPSIPGLDIVRVGKRGFADPEGLVAARLGRDVLYLVRPDQHIAARFVASTPEGIAAAFARAIRMNPKRTEAAA